MAAASVNSRTEAGQLTKGQVVCAALSCEHERPDVGLEGGYGRSGGDG